MDQPANSVFPNPAADGTTDGLIATASSPAPVREGLFDFGKDGVGWLELRGTPRGEYEFVLGELTDAAGNVANEHPGSTIRCLRVACAVDADPFRVPLPPDGVNLRGYEQAAPAIRLPERFGVVMPFRYVQVVRSPAPVAAENLVRWMVHVPMDLSQSSFACDNPVLNEVYDLCKYSMLATSFCGLYVDGDRERTPYEGDAYLNQLGHYAVEAGYAMARRTLEWLIDHPTWPTEWRQLLIKMAWADWMWSGDTGALAAYYDRLKDDKLLLRYAREDGLLVTGGERNKGCAIPGGGDMVDWPMGERDGFVFRPVNAVINAFHHRNLLEMADMARALGKEADAADFTTRAAKVRTAFNAVFLDTATGLYRDGEGTDHLSLHANAAALAVGLAETRWVPGIVDFLDRKGMACSVYFAQYLLEAFCEAGRADLAVKYMAATGDRSWKGMIDFGSTITMEAWNVKAKPNLDLNHAWGAAPINILSRYILGVTPLAPGFAKARIAPQPGSLGRVRAKVPTAKGAIRLDIDGDRLMIDSPTPALVEWGERRTETAPGRHVFHQAVRGEFDCSDRNRNN